jgi:hypothetical protein
VAHHLQWEAIAMTTGIAAARIIKHGTAVQTSSAETFWRWDSGHELRRRELQIAANMVAKTPAASNVHIIRIAKLMFVTFVSPDA